MTSQIQVVEKASHVCARCRSRKQRCDRMLPRCSRCASKLRKCDYTWHLDALNHSPVSQESVALVERGSCGLLDLTNQAQLELLRLASGYFSNGRPDLTVRFGRLVCDILFESGVTISGLIDDYADTLHRWFPLINLKQLRKDTQSVPEELISPTVLILLLAILLLTAQPCGHIHHLADRRLHNTLNLVVVALQSQSKPDLCLVQTQALISLYECGHGMTQQAHLTLSSAITLATLLATNTGNGDGPLHWQTALMMIDSMISLSAIDEPLPILCTSSSPMTKVIRSQVQSYNSNEFFSLDLPSQKLHMTAQVFLLAERCLQYVYSIENGIVADEDYALIDEDMERIVQGLISNEKTYSWMFCDSITMVLCCHLIIREAHVRSTKALLGSRENLTLQASRRMAWDTCRLSIETIKSTEISRTSFVSMNSTFRALLCVIDRHTGRAEHEETDQLLLKLRLFCGRWALGDRYLRRMELILSSDDDMTDRDAIKALSNSSSHSTMSIES